MRISYSHNSILQKFRLKYSKVHTRPRKNILYFPVRSLLATNFKKNSVKNKSRLLTTITKGFYNTLEYNKEIEITLT